VIRSDSALSLAQRSQTITSIVEARVAIFDLDGTLVDSWPLLEPIYVTWALRRGLDPTVVLQLIGGYRTADALGVLLRSHEAVFLETRFLENQEFRATRNMGPMAGARQVLQKLPPNCWGVVTSSSRRNALAKLESCGLPVPSILVAADDVASGKPDPQGYLTAAQLFGLSPFEMVVFEDSVCGVEAAVASGATTVAVGLRKNYSAAVLQVNTLNEVEPEYRDSVLRVQLTRARNQPGSTTISGHGIS
jgi:mannitol-1-/sugar-/sorbitol-6-phosphatase